jgi:hypothetical protein
MVQKYTYIQIGFDKECLEWLREKGHKKMSFTIRKLIHKERLANTQALTDIAKAHIGRQPKEPT